MIFGKPIDKAEVVTSDPLHDRMTQNVSCSTARSRSSVCRASSSSTGACGVGDDPQLALKTINNGLGLSLDALEIAYQAENLGSKGSVHRNPNRCRILYVFTGQQRALPSQNLQRTVKHSWCYQIEIFVWISSRNARKKPTGNYQRLQ